MASLFTSCPTFLLSQLPSSFLGKEDTFYPTCIAIWPLCDLVHHDANVWPWAGSHVGHFGPMRILWMAPRQSTVTWLDPRRLPNIDKKKKKIRYNVDNLLICDDVPLFMSQLLLLDRKRFGIPAAFALHSSGTFFFFNHPPLFRDNAGWLPLFTGQWQCREVKPSP